jgi:hypothetical protein
VLCRARRKASWHLFVSPSLHACVRACVRAYVRRDATVCRSRSSVTIENAVAVPQRGAGAAAESDDTMDSWV